MKMVDLSKDFCMFTRPGKSTSIASTCCLSTNGDIWGTPQLSWAMESPTLRQLHRNLQGFEGIYRDNAIFLCRDIYRDIQMDIQGDNTWQCTIRYSNMVMENHKFIDYNAKKIPCQRVTNSHVCRYESPTNCIYIYVTLCNLWAFDP